MNKNFISVKNIFKFHNVGQGLFYTGSIWNKREDWFNFVFDCGSLNEHYLQNAIDEYVQALPNKKIDMVVISHLHEDHFNGLVELASKAKINEIYLPYLPKNFVKLILGYVLFFENGNVRDNLRTRTKHIVYNFMLKVYGVEIDGNDEYVRELQEIKMPKEVHFEDNKQIGNLFEVHPYWSFELYEKSFNVKVIDNLKTKLEGIVDDLDNLSILDFLYDGPFKDNIDKIAMAFTEVFNDMNLTSMILVHYPVSPKAVKSTYYSVIDRKLNLIYKYIDIRSVTVLTGDATGFKNYKGFLSSVKGKKVLCLQVPHHGSYKNWRTLNGKLGLQLDNGIRYILPFGIGNSYGHPNVEVLKDLDKYHCDYYFVTQYSAFEYEIEIYIPKELALDNSLCCGYMI